MAGRRRQRDEGASLVETMGTVRADYDAANASRFKRTRTGIPAMGSHADWHIRNESRQLHLLEYARDLDRNDPVVTRMLDLSADATVKDGIGSQAATGYSKLDDAIDQRLKDWAENPQECDIEGQETFGQMQHSAFRQMQLDGDILAVGTRDGQLQHFEAHRIRSPSRLRRKNLSYGVEMNGFRKPQRFYITKEDIEPTRPVSTLGEVQPFPAYDENGVQVAYHLCRKKRKSETRTVTALAPIFDYSGMSGDTIFAKLVQQQSVSIWSLFIERTNEYVGTTNTPIGSVETQTRSDGTTEAIENVTPGQVFRGQVGEKPHAFSSNIPNAEYFEQMRQIHTIMMSCLGLPYMLVFLDASDTNFSGWRGAFDVAKFGWRRHQGNLVTRYVAPIRRWKITQFLQDDAGLAKMATHRDVVSPFGCKFNLPSYPYVNPYQDAQAAVVRLGNLLTSPQRLHAEQGEDAWDIATESIDYWAINIEEAQKRATKINDKLSLAGTDRISWRDLLAKPNAQGLQIAQNATPEPEQTAKPQAGGATRGN